MNRNVLRVLGTLATSLVVGIAFAGVASAAKPVHVISWSNGFPSGEHFNLNIHGKKDGYQCDPSGGGGSVFVPEYGTSEIQYVQNKKSSVENLTVLDACGGFDGDAASVQLPAEEYQVYARILGKPAKDGEPREVLFYPHLVEACNDSGTENFTEATTCDESFLLGTGIVTKDGAFDTDGQKLESESPRKGKNTATDISGMFQWSGWACNQTADTDGDGQITLGDVPGDLNGDNVTDEADLEIFLASECVRLESAWVFDIADLVVYGWDYHNNGAKLLQVRFYPTDTTTFE